MLLIVENKTLSSIVLNSELGSIGPRKTVTLDLTIDQIERSRSDLVRLAASGVIVWGTTKSPDTSDDAGEAATVEYVDNNGGGQEHNHLAGLQGGTAGEYVHLTGAEYARLASNARILRGIRGFTATDFYERAAGSALSGNADPGFEVVLAVVVDVLESGGYGDREIISNTSPFVPPGYMLGIGDLRPMYAMTDGGGSRHGIFFGNWARASISKALLFLSLGYDNAASQRFLTVNGQYFQRTSQTGFTPDPLLPVRLGANANDGSSSARGLTVVGYAMRTSGVLTSDQRLDAYRQFLLTGDFPSTEFQHRFSLSSLALGAAPTILVDDIGGLDMTRTGTGLVVVDEYWVGQAITTDPSPDAIVTRSNGFFAWPNQQVDSVGPTLITANYVQADTTANTVGLLTPNFPFNGFEIIVVDVAANAGSNNITVTASGGQSIDGSGSATINTDRGYLRLIYNEPTSDWLIVGSS